MTEKLKISVALCTYNGREFLREQLDSIAAQSRPPDELVICDDGSEDGTVEIIEGFSTRAAFPVSYYVNDHNLGYAKNFEKAISLCKGDIIALSDQDDVWSPRKLETMERAFLGRPGLGIACSDARVVDERLTPLGYGLWRSVRLSEKEKRLIRDEKAIDVLLKYNFVAGATMAFNAAYKDIALPIPDGWVHDAWIALVCAAVGGLAIIDEPLIDYRKHRGQQIGTGGSGSLPRHLVAEARKALAGSRGYAARCREENLRDIERSLERYGHARGRLIAREARIEDKLAHLRARASMSTKPRHRRLAGAIHEISSGRYRRYSNGISYILKDVLL